MQCRLCALVVTSNVILAALAYSVFGWHFIRGYNEVVNFIVVTLIGLLAGFNIILTAVLSALGLGKAKRVRAPRLSQLAAGCGVSAILVMASLWVVPVLGRFANHRGLLDTSLVEAARYGDHWLVAHLVTNGADPNQKDPTLGTTPLHYAAWSGEYQLVQLLLEAGADPNSQDSGAETPLHLAVDNNANLQTIELLAEFGADPDIEDRRGDTALDKLHHMLGPKRAIVYQIFDRSPPPIQG